MMLCKKVSPFKYGHIEGGSIRSISGSSIGMGLFTLNRGYASSQLHRKDVVSH